jgi:hypothetical protein
LGGIIALLSRRPRGVGAVAICKAIEDGPHPVQDIAVALREIPGLVIAERRHADPGKTGELRTADTEPLTLGA